MTDRQYVAAPAPTTARTVLVPDEQHFLHTLIIQLEEDLLGPLVSASDDSRAGMEDAWELPDDLDAQRPYSALRAIVRALPDPLRSQDERDHFEHPARRTLVSADGRTERLPLYPVTIQEADVAALEDLHARLDAALNRRGENGELGDLLYELAEHAPPRIDPIHLADRRPPNRAELVGSVAKVVAVLRLRTDDTELLLREISAKGPGETVQLTGAGNAAYQRLATELNNRITGGAALDRFLY